MIKKQTARIDSAFERFVLSACTSLAWGIIKGRWVLLGAIVFIAVFGIGRWMNAW